MSPFADPIASTFWLSMHVPYACQDEGACCSSGWPIPIERPQAARVRAAVADGRLHAPVRWLGVAEAQPADVAGVLDTDNDGCVFHHRQRCDLQGALGHDTLPSCCQHFPRDCVIDARGVFVTLSHYCPTAARLLFTHEGPVEIVEGPLPVPGGAAEGLDARETLPPLLTSGVLMDYPGLTAWEAHCVSWLGGRENPAGKWAPEQALDLLESHAASLSRWRPGGRSLADTVAALSNDARPIGATEPRWGDEAALRAVARRALPSAQTWLADPIDLDRSWRRVQPAWAAFAPIINRLLAAHAFASWMAYQGDGVVPGIRRLRLALAVLRAEAVRACESSGDLNQSALQRAIRQTDLLLVHLVDRETLALGLHRAI